MGMVFAIILLGYRFDLIIPIEAYVLLIVIFLFSVVLFIAGCKVKN